MCGEKADRKLAKVIADLRAQIETLETKRDQNEGESEWRQLLDLLPDIVYKIDPEGHFVQVNSAVRLLGYEPQELIGKHFSTILEPGDVNRISRECVVPQLAGQFLGRADSPRLFDERRTRENMTRDLEVHLRPKHARRSGTDELGSPAPIEYVGELAATGYYEPDVDAPEKEFRGTIGIIRDITHRKRREDRERQAEKMRAFGQLAGGVAHDFNNQLTGILGFADLLRTELQDPKLAEYAEGIIASARSARDLTIQLLAFARRGPRTNAPVNLHKTIADVVSLLERTADKRVRIRQVLEASPATIMGDQAQLQNAILNVALNSCDALPDGGNLTFETSIADFAQSRFGARLLEVPAGHYICVSINDNGVGMDKETQSRIFEPFFTTRPPGEGTGMGLAAVLGTVKSHGGGVFVYSEVGRGTTVKLYLPLSTESEEGAAAPDVRPAVLETGEGNILIVDDEPAIRDIGVGMLEYLGYRVTTCANGAEAAARYRADHQDLDLVLLDLSMPEMGGRECFEVLQEINPDVRAVIMSGFSADDSVEDLLDMGARGFLQKPFEHAELARTVAAAMAR